MKEKLYNLRGQPFYRLTYNIPNKSFLEFTLEEPNGEKLEKILEGHVRWDGCSDMFPDHCLHFCEVERVKLFNEVLIDLYKIASEEIPYWDDF